MNVGQRRIHTPVWGQVCGELTAQASRRRFDVVGQYSMRWSRASRPHLHIAQIKPCQTILWTLKHGFYQRILHKFIATRNHFLKTHKPISVVLNGHTSITKLRARNSLLIQCIVNTNIIALNWIVSQECIKISPTSFQDQMSQILCNCFCISKHLVEW